MQGQANNDEIDLRTLLLILRRHIKLLIVVTVVVTLLGSVWALTRPKEYSYKQALYLTHYYSAGQITTVQPTKDIVQQIKNVYLPAFQQQYNQQHAHRQIAIVDAKKIYNITGQSARILYLQAYGDKQFADVVQQANQFILKKIMAEQAPYKIALMKYLQAQIAVLQQEIPMLEKLRDANNNYIVDSQVAKQKLTNKTNSSDILRDIYINSLGAQQNQNNLVTLKIQLANLQQQLASIQTAKLSAITTVAKENQTSKSVKIILSFLLGLFLSIVIIFLRNAVE